MTNAHRIDAFALAVDLARETLPAATSRTDAAIVDPARPTAARYVCGDCHAGEHDACTGERLNGEPCECAPCYYAATGEGPVRD